MTQYSHNDNESENKTKYCATTENIKVGVMKRMGINFSEPIPNFGEDLGYLAIVVRCRDRIRLLHAPKSVVEMVQGILRYDCLLLFYKIFSKNRQDNNKR